MMMKKIATALAVVLGIGMCGQVSVEAAVHVGNKPASAMQSAQSVPAGNHVQPAKAKKAKPEKKHNKQSNQTKHNNQKNQAVHKEKQPAVQKKQSTAQNTANGNWRVKVAQTNLHELGYLGERPSGKLTEATKTALQKFQKQYKLKESGELDEATYRKLTWEAFVRKGISDVRGNDVVAHAAKLKGVPYVFGGTTPKGFDCSGYVQYVFNKLNAKLPRVADEQVLEGVFVTQRQLRPGDLVFFTTYAPGASHVGIYAGNNQFWNSTSSRGVMLSSLKEDYWRTRYYGARRVLISNGEIK